MRALEGEEKMKTKNLLKKVAAFGATVALVGSTVAGALAAANIANVKDEFIKNGAFNAYVVVGADAKPIDVAGAVEIAAAFANVRVESEAAGTATVSVLSTKGKEFTLTSEFDAEGNPSGGSGTVTYGDSDSDNIPALANVEYEFDDDKYNATISLAIDKTKMNVTRAGGVKVGKDAVTVTLSTTHQDSGHNNITVGDMLNWFGKLYEVVDVNTTAPWIKLGNLTSEILTIGDEVEVDGTPIKVIDFASDGNEVRLQVGDNDPENYGTGWHTVGDVRFKVEDIWVGTQEKTVKISYSPSSLLVEEDKPFPVDDRFYVSDIVLSDTADDKVEVKLNTTIELDEELEKGTISEAVGLILDDISGSITKDDVGATWATSGDSGDQIRIEEYSGGEIEFTCGDSGDGDGNDDLQINAPNNIPWIVIGYKGSRITGNSGVYAVDPTEDTPVYLYEGDMESQEIVKIWCDSGSVTWKNWSTSSGWQGISEDYVTSNGVYVDNGNKKFYGIAAKVEIGDTDDMSSPTTLYLPYQIDKVYVGTTEYDAYYTKEGAKITWDGDNYKATVEFGDGKKLVVPMVVDTSAHEFYMDDAANIELEGSKPFENASAVASYDENKAETFAYGGVVALKAETDGDWGKEAVADRDTSDAVVVFYPEKTLTLKVGEIVPTDVQLEVDETKTVGETTLTLKSVGGSVYAPVTVESGVSKLDTDISSAELDRPVILVGGPAVNDLVEELANAGKTMSVDDWREEVNGTRTWEHRAIVDLIEDAFNNQTALVVAGYGGEDTLKAARLLAGYILGENTLFESVNGTRAVIDTESGTLVEE